MRRMLSSLVMLLLLAGLISLPAFAADDKKDDKPADKKDDKEKKDKEIKAGQATGKIQAINESKRTVKLELSYPYKKLNQGEYNAYMQASGDYQRAIARRDVNGARNAANSMAQHQAKLYTIETQKQSVELQTVEEVVVRVANPPPAFDDKGALKKYTKKELDELKGPDKKLPGYTSEFGSLRANQVVTVMLVQKKSDTKPTKPNPRPKTKEEEAEEKLANLPQISMIVIMVEPKD